MNVRLSGIRNSPPARFAKNLLAMSDWKNRGFLGNSPQFVKEKILTTYGIPNATWVESGTFVGTTTEFLRKRSPQIHTIEPSRTLYEIASQRFKGKNVTLHNGVSEYVLPQVLKELRGDVNFWLDGHYSGGETFEGSSRCPVPEELKAIETHLSNFSNLAILIDDVRCFVSSSSEFSSYPSLDFLVDWANRNKMKWNIVHDIFVIYRE